MSPELKQLCTIVTISLPIGLIAGLFLRKRKPEWCKTYTKSYLNKKWWLLLVVLVFFGIMSVKSFVGDRQYFGLFYLAGAVLEAFALVRYGFRPLSPEMAAKIDSRVFPKKE